MARHDEDNRQNKIMESVLVKAKWANDHLGDLHRSLDDFFDTRPYVIQPEKDTQTLDHVYYFVGANPIPREIAGHVGDILYNLRSTLDHLAWQLVIANGGNPGSGTGFPIYDPKAKDLKSFIARKVAGMRQETIEAIERLNPYKGGNDSLWLLHELNIIDKHHEILGIGTAHLGHTATPSQQRKILEMWQNSHPGIKSAPNVSGVLVAAPVIRILKPGDVIRTVAEADYDPNMQVQLQISFNVPGTIEAKPIVDILKDMKDLVIKIVCDFRTNRHFRIGP